eukprot:UN13406
MEITFLSLFSKSPLFSDQNPLLLRFTFFNKIVERKILEFQWKSLYGIINTEVRLKKWGKSNGKCILCRAENESQMHLMYQCLCYKADLGTCDD